MGGAARNEKRRRQEEAEARLRAAGITPPARKQTNRTPLVVVGVVAALALAAVAGFLLTREDAPAVVASYPVAVSGAVVTAGQPGAPVAVDVYEDYLCPQCERFENRYGDELTTALNEGEVSVRFHHVAILDTLTEPPGYSTRAANAALCVAGAAPSAWPAFHDRLFAEQPAEGGAGLTDEQLLAFATEAGAPPSVAECLAAGQNAEAVAAETRAAAGDPAVQTAEGRFGTPTVLLGGSRVDLNDTSWLADAIGG